MLEDQQLDAGSPDKEIAPGALIAAVIPGQPPHVGIVSLASHSISSAIDGGLGVEMEDSKRGLEVVEVIARRYEVPLRKGDIVVSIDGKPTPDLDAYYALAERAQAGDQVRVGVRRGSEALELKLAMPPSNFFLEQYGLSSLRWWGFPSVLDTDTRFAPKQCGAPMIDTTGRVVGIAMASFKYVGSDLGRRHVLPAHIARSVVGE